MGKVYLGEQQISGMHILTGPTNTQDTNLTDAKMLPEGYSAYGPNGKVVGTAHNIQASEVTATMSPNAVKNGNNYYAVFNITMPTGYYDGSPITVNSLIEGFNPASMPSTVTFLGIKGTKVYGVTEITDSDGYTILTITTK